MISGTGRYALRILGFLAERPGEWIQASQIAEGTGIPANYLSKILTQLGKHGIVESQKGWGGGFTLSERDLARPIIEVVELFDGRLSHGECVLGLPVCGDEHACPLHDTWVSIRSAYDEMLRTVHIGDLRTQ